MPLNSPSPSWATVEWLVPQLARNLSLVRPVSMSDDTASDWLAAGAAQLTGYGKMMVEAGLDDARKRCTYHGQIVPHVIQFMEDNFNFTLGKPLPRHVPRAEPALPPPSVAGLIGQAAKALRA